MAAREHAVVVGAGMAGLLAARVLSDAFARVTIVERDAPSSGVRRGVPQGAHLHGLLDGGRRIMEELYPGLTDELVAAGAPTGEPLRDTRWYLHGRRLAPTATGMRSVLASRPFLESALRARAVAVPGVDVAGPGTVTGLCTDGSRAVTGVRVRPRSGREESLAADLVVDASGRGSRVADWLRAAGHAAPVQERVDVDLGYATRFYRRRPEHLDGQLAVTVSTIPRFRGGGCLAVDGGRWLVTLAGMLGDHPPADAAGFEAFAATLPTPDIHRVIGAAEPLGDPVPYRFGGSLRRRFDRLPDPARGFVALGDAVCSVNPLYAQGMSLAAQQVRVLRAQLASPGPLDPRTFYRDTARLCDAAWEIATRSDLALPEVDGRRPLPARVLDGYIRRVQLAAHRDPVVSRAFLRVANLVDAPATLLAPRVLVRVLRPGAC
ncbi:FAD-dependent oxidoreductase [Pseudonocardia abyssalis]|uniref:FAD-dependent monooxygenase n=1 Tax=Pseudonocardia abyssalis TaxID=2792008 RepID=A0ABS6UNP6_9PSEU|nr:FAD-dependent monooxygenase [Pseudonocardia abyssalis]MBW0117343.1 FAD-dependent monooxygenase [Pseudonocardia abyssalis]MBW0133860.1 FAD-dependent monooxygenase [Pseudonocardia abyssalis]